MIFWRCAVQCWDQNLNFRSKICVDYLSNKMAPNEKKFELKSCRSHRDLQFLYKVYIHPSSYKLVMIFWKWAVQVKRHFAGWTGDNNATVPLSPVHPAVCPYRQFMNWRQEARFAKKKLRYIFLKDRKISNIKIKIKLARFHLEVEVIGSMKVWFYI